MKFSPFSLLFLVILFWESNAQDKGKVKCYTCLGRDLDNCLVGEVSCQKCMKVVDAKHSVVAKGCQPLDKSDLVDKAQITLQEVKLPWDNYEPVSGIGEYCNDVDFCNAASSLQLSLVFVLSAISLAFLRILV